jgi:Tfp pilus assembly PilM family ATPase
MTSAARPIVATNTVYTKRIDPFHAPVTAITIETTCLRALVVRRDTVVAWATVPLAPGLVVGGRLTDPPALSRLIRDVVTTYCLPTRRLVSYVSGFQAVARLLRLPPIATADLAAAVQSEARRQLSLPLDSLALAWQMVARTPEATLVYLVAVPRDLVDGHLLAWHGAGLRLRALDLKPLALVRSLGVTTGVIANLEADSLDLVVVVDGLPEIVRTVPLPQLAGGPALGIEIVGDEIYRTAKFYDDSHKEAPLAPAAPIILTGDMANAQALSTAIAPRTGRPVVVGAPCLTCPPLFLAPAYVATAGLVLKRGLGIQRSAA